MKLTLLLAVALTLGCHTDQEIDCDECSGSGVVVYKEGHILVELQSAQPGKEYSCPMCGGSGVLELE